jgi:hypothetical protein
MEILTKNDTGLRGLGGTDIRRIVRGEACDLYQERMGLAAPEDLTWSQPVQMGRACEDLVRRFYGHDTGSYVYSLAEAAEMYQSIYDRTLETPSELSADGLPDTMRHVAYEWALARPDGIVHQPSSDTLKGLECKVVNPFWDWRPLVENHYPQIQWLIEVSGLEQWDFSAFLGNSTRRHSTIARDPDYIADLLDHGERFMTWLAGGKAPSFATLPAPREIAVVGERIVDMEAERNNAWAECAGTWLEAKHQADTWGKAEKAGNAALKAMVPADASEVFGYGAKIRRTRKGLTLTRSGVE